MRFQFLGTQQDESGQEWCYVLDTELGATLKSPVKSIGMAEARANGRTIFTAPGAVKDAIPEPQKSSDPAGDVETAEDREKRLKGGKVPPAFLGDIRRMNLDPSKTDGRTDVTPVH